MREKYLRLCLCGSAVVDIVCASVYGPVRA